MAMYGMYERRHIESVGKGRSYEWNYTKMATIYDAYEESKRMEDMN